MFGPRSWRSTEAGLSQTRQPPEHRAARAPAGALSTRSGSAETVLRRAPRACRRTATALLGRSRVLRRGRPAACRAAGPSSRTSGEARARGPVKRRESGRVRPVQIDSAAASCRTTVVPPGTRLLPAPTPDAFVGRRNTLIARWRARLGQGRRRRRQARRWSSRRLRSARPHRRRRQRGSGCEKRIRSRSTMSNGRPASRPPCSAVPPGSPTVCTVGCESAEYASAASRAAGESAATRFRPTRIMERHLGTRASWPPRSSQIFEVRASISSAKERVAARCLGDPDERADEAGADPRVALRADGGSAPNESGPKPSITGDRVLTHTARSGGAPAPSLRAAASLFLFFYGGQTAGANRVPPLRLGRATARRRSACTRGTGRHRAPVSGKGVRSRSSARLR
jgi:hypothetical protein